MNTFNLALVMICSITYTKVDKESDVQPSGSDSLDGDPNNTQLRHNKREVIILVILI